MLLQPTRRRLVSLGIATILFCTLLQPLCAAPSERLRMSITLNDGTILEVTRMGDEFFSYYLTDAGERVVCDSLGYHVVQSEEQWQALTSEVGARRNAVRRKVGSAQTAALGQHGVQRVPVILVSFADKDFLTHTDVQDVQHYYHLYCNGNEDGTPYTGHGSKGSLREYFADQSNGEFLPEFTVVGPVKLDSVYAYYGANSADGKRKDLRYDKFCAEAVTKVTATGIDWNQFDNNSDGAVDLVMFIFAGLGENNSNDDDAIWPKEVGGSSTMAGVRFAANSSVSECRLKSDGNGGYYSIPDGIGVFVHEMSHALGLPDFYDTRNVAFGMDFWSVMDYGEYVDNGFTPAGYTAYERDFMGWQPLREVTEPTTLHIPSFASGGCGWKVVSDFNPDEYYILENRQADGWDVKMCRLLGHGLMISHIDYLASAWNTNKVNIQPDHQRMTIIPANNMLIGSNNAQTMSQWQESLRGNLWPGALDNHELTDNTTPASVLFTGEYMSKPIVDIQESEDGMVTLKFMPRGTLRSVTGLQAQQQDEQGATLMWEPVLGAQCYNLRILDGDETIITADSLVAHSYEVRDLQENHIYTFQVQPLADDYLDGDWSVPATFVTLPTGISDMSESELRVRVFGTDGLFLTECQADEIGRLALRSGIYLLRYPNGQVRKVLVR